MLITVRVPATSANLGPGFDCLGLALDIWSTVTVRTVEGRPPRESIGGRLVRQGVQAAFEGKQAPRLDVTWDEAIPLARGLGASAALRAAGLLAGNAMLDGIHDLERLFEMGTSLEGFPDNISPCLFGGLQVGVRGRERLIHLAFPVPAALKVVVFVPDFEMPTQESRRRLPKSLSREDAIFNSSRVALFLAALAAERYDLLDEATQDRMHQPVRGEIFPGLGPIMQGAKDGGAVAAYLSGGGSTVAAFTVENEERVARLMTQAAISHGYSGRSIITRPTEAGAHIVSGGAP
ncbi:MAG TPA: homoserine kinase [Dehalococcoidia bacterium]|nr:homoserine kinase [Dehalococcoidia bacterium]